MTTTHTRDFLARVLPWNDENEYCNVHWMSTKLRQDGKPFVNGEAVHTLDEAVRLIERANSREDVRDIYVCMSKQSEAERKTFPSGYSFVSALRSQDNATALKSLFADIDVKPGAYENTRDAITALRDFIASTKLPMPTAVVATGSGGVHVHWALDRQLSRLEWQPLANALSRALKAAGVHCDTQCTIDSARILRPPGTFNYKSGEPKPVELLTLGDETTVEVMKAALEPFIKDEPVTTAHVVINLPKRDVVVHNTDLTAGISGGKPKPVNLDTVATNCGFVKEAIDTGGAALTNPLWFLTTSIATFTEGERADAHRMASGHPGYTVESTDALFDRVMAERQKRDIGWPKCDKIELSGCTACVSCPMRGMGKSPLNFTEAPSTDTLPDGFVRDQAGLVYERHVDDSGNVSNKLVCQYPMTNAWLQDNPWVLHFTTRAAAGRTAKVEAPLADLAPKDGVGKVFARHGLMIRDNAAKPLREFLVSWIQKLQQTKDAVVSSSPFGWTNAANGKLEGFTYGGRVWAVGFDRPAASPDPVLAYQYTPKGEIGPWLEMSKIICDQSRPGLNAILASAFGGPLVRFTGESGIMLNAYSSESGIGKTTTMRVAQAVWADPIKAMQQLDDTPLSVVNRIGQLKVLPMFWDELKTDQQTQKFVSLAFQITSGKEKGRLNADVTQRDVGTWQTMMVSASNESILDAVTRQNTSTMAGLYRCFEYAVIPGTKGQIEQSLVSRKLSACYDNYGHAGLIYAKFLGANHERIAQEVADLHDQLRTEFCTTNEERFWLATMTVIIAGANYANELGLTTIDLQELKIHLGDVLSRMRSEIKDAPVDMKNTMSVSTILAQFINAMRARHAVTTNKIHVGAGKPAAGSIQIVSDTSRTDGIYVQIGRDDGLMRISSTYFSRWMSEHDYSRHAFTKALKEEFGMRIVNGKLCSGTDKVGAMEYLMELDMNDPRLKGFIE